MSQLNVDTIKKADGTGNLSVPAETGTVVTTASPSLGRRNRVINGDFSVWQRGTSFTDLATGAFSADRWKIDYRPNGNINAAQQDYVSYKALRFTNAYTGSQSFNFEHKVEDVTFFSGKEVTLSFYAKASEAFTMGIAAYENYGSGGSAQTTAVSSSKSITTTRQQFTVTFTCTDMSAKTVGLSNCMRLNFSNPLSQDAWVEIDHVQLEVGSVATPFEHRSFGEELALCQRYYWRFGWPSVHGGQPNVGLGFYLNSARVDMAIDLPVTMRTNPSIVANSGTGYWNAYVNGDDLFNSWSGVNAPTNNTFIIYSTDGLSGSAGNAVLVGKKDNAASLAADAEL
jgi:hypothetical protein